MTKRTLGSLEVISGPMFAGKTKLLLRRIRDSKGKKIVIKPAHDTRYGQNTIVSHDGATTPAIAVRSPKEITAKVSPRTRTVAIDEAQFFGEELVPVIHRLLQEGKHVVISGLSVMYDQQPFSPIPELMAIADKVTKLQAKCAECGASTPFHTRIAKKTSDNIRAKLFIGGAESYKPLCRNCIVKKPAVLK